MRLKKLISAVLAITISTSAITFNAFAESKVLAFPEAEGGGMFALGARASDNVSIYHVTNLSS